ncbi:MAG: hypothetical protein WCC87_09360 [Candidatus Korobacteraceae bacterium]
MLDYRRCDVNSAAELDSEIRDIFALDQVGRGDEISGTLYVDYVGEATKQASLIPALERRGVQIVWRKKPQVRKAYIRRAWREKPEDNHHTIEFCEFGKDARYWTTRESAERDMSDLERGIKVPSAWGGSFVCRELTLEQLPSGEYVISLEAPFIYTPKAESST